MTTYNTSRYRYIGWLPNRILEASELDRLQQIAQGVAQDNKTQWSWELGAVYAEGATLNVTPTIAGSTITLTPTNNAIPMLVFVRGHWEILQPAEAPAVTLGSGQTKLYLNWWLVIRDNTVDPTLVDTNTGEPTAQMGELTLQVSATDNSATALADTTYFQKNTVPTVLFTFAPKTGGGVTLVSSTGVLTQALASGSKAGLVSLTTTTSSGKAVASDDASVTNARVPVTGSVQDSSVRTPVLDGQGKVQTLGTGAGKDPGGITSSKIIHTQTSQLLSVLVEALRAQANATQLELTSHEPKPLGNGTHVMPTASQVGAVPASHVGLPLGLATSHQPIVSADSGGFEVLRNAGASASAMDAAFAVLMSNVLQGGLLHNGDVYSLRANGTAVYPGSADGDGPMTTVSLGLLSTIASVLAGHVNKTSHKNPHGLAISDLGFSYQITGNSLVVRLFGLILQVFTGSNNLGPGGRGAFTENFPVAFPTKVFGVFPVVLFDTQVTSANWQGVGIYAQPGTTLNSASLFHDVRSDGSADTSYKALIFAVGY